MLILPSIKRITLNSVDLVLDGNSLVANMVGLSSYALLGSPSRTKQNFGVGGQNTLEMINDAPTQVDAAFATDKVLIVWEIRNQIYFGANPRTAVDSVKGYCLGRKTRGWKVLLMGCLPADQTPPSSTKEIYNAQLVEANSLLRSEHSQCADSFLDMATVATLQNPMNPTYYTDGVHLSNIGYQQLMPHINQAIERIRV